MQEQDGDKTIDILIDVMGKLHDVETQARESREALEELSNRLFKA